MKVAVYTWHTRGYDGYTACLWHMDPDFYTRSHTVVAVWTDAGWVAADYGPAKADMDDVYRRPDTVLVGQDEVEAALKEALDAA